MGVNFVFFVNKHETLSKSLSSESQNLKISFWFREKSELFYIF